MSDRHSRLHRFLIWSAVASLVLVLGGLIVLQQTRLDRELSELPATERAALYERTITTLQHACVQPSGGTLSSYCREQAEFVEHFPECDQQCRKLAARSAPQAWR